MTRPNLPATFARQQADLQRQLDQQRASQLGNSTIRGGALQALNAAGQAQAVYGEYTFTSGTYLGVTVYGLIVFDGAGRVVLVLGLLPNGIYGLGVFGDDGDLVVSASSAGFAAGPVALNSTGLNAGGVTLTSAGLTAGGVMLTSSGLAAGGVTVTGSGVTAGPVTLTSSGLTAGPVTVGAAGLTVADNAGHGRVALGLISNGDYGLLVVDAAGNNQEVLPSVSAYVDASVSTTSTTPSGDVNGPSVSVVVGASGRVRVEASAYVALGQGNTTALASLYIDGGSSSSLFALSAQGPDPVAANVGTRRVYTGLTPGTHTFEMRYQTSAGSSNFGGRSLTVTPF